MNGRFITFEGIDGAGKSTHVPWFAEQLRKQWRTVLQTREPGGPPLSERLRELLLHEPMSAETELLLVFAARSEHLHQHIRPALARGEWVVCDRFTDSTFAYQGAGRGMSGAAIAWLESWVQHGLQPDRTYWFDLDPVLAAQRRAQARAADRFEAEDVEFFRRVREGYAARQSAHPARFVRLDGAMPVDMIQKLLVESIVNL